MNVKEALFYTSLENKYVKCSLCPHNCRIPIGGVGKCRVRKNERGKLVSLNYGKITAYNMDPIEKKPLFHFYPGTRIFSIGSFGCNLECHFCQNFSIVHGNPKIIDTTAQNLVDIGKNEKNNIGIAYTYNEPSIWFEFVYEVAKLAHEAGLKNVLVTNGYINGDPLNQLLPYVDGMNIDLKGMNESFYEKICGGGLEPVKETIKRAAKSTHVEITTLVIDDTNDSLEEIGQIARWLAKISPDLPLHLSRYFPAYKMENPPTSIETMVNAVEEARKYLNYVYMGNVPGVDRNTYCPNCQGKIISRAHGVEVEGLEKGKCSHCGEKINIVMD